MKNVLENCIGIAYYEANSKHTSSRNRFRCSQCILAMSTATTVMKGTCYTESECTANGGRASGNCASGGRSFVAVDICRSRWSHPAAQKLLRFVANRGKETSFEFTTSTPAL
jgi:hypothetical protein